MKLVLFDCDGTLVDSAGFIHDCMVATFVEAGFAPPEPAATRGVIGLSLDIAIGRLLGHEPDAQIAVLTDRYKSHFIELRSGPDFSERLYDGVAELIDELKVRADLVLGMVTGKSRRGVKSVIGTHGFGNAFFVVRTADDCPSKPHPAMVLECCSEAGIDPGDTIVVGDAIYDMQMASAAKATGIGVAWGYASRDELAANGARAILNEPAGLLAYLDE